MQELAGFVERSSKVNYERRASFSVNLRTGVWIRRLTGDLEYPICANFWLFVGQAAKADQNCVALFVDELQYVREEQLGALVSALHFGLMQRRLPIALTSVPVCPKVRGPTRKSEILCRVECLISHRSFALSREDATMAIAKPALSEGVEFEPGAIQSVVTRHRRLSLLPPSLGKIRLGPGSMLVAHHNARRGSCVVTSRSLTSITISSWFDLTGPHASGKSRYLLAMAHLGRRTSPLGRHCSATQTRSDVQSAKSDSNLIDKGMIWSPAHGDTAFNMSRCSTNS